MIRFSKKIVIHYMSGGIVAIQRCPSLGFHERGLEWLRPVLCNTDSSDPSSYEDEDVWCQHSTLHRHLCATEGYSGCRDLTKETTSYKLYTAYTQGAG